MANTFRRGWPMVAIALLAGPLTHGDEWTWPPASLVGYQSPVAAHSDDARFAAMQQEIDSLRARVDAQSGCVSPQCSDLTSTRCGSGWEAGAALVFAKPHYKESFEVASTAIASPFETHLRGFEFEYSASPRVWLGYQRCDGLGVRASYWQYDQAASPRQFIADAATNYSAQAMTVIFPATAMTYVPGDVLSTASGLEVHTIDLEGTQTAQIGGFLTLASAGLRYASLDQDTRATVTGFVPQVLEWSRTFYGIGPTVGLELRRPIGRYGLELIGGGRGSLLYGRKNLARSISPPQTPIDPTLQQPAVVSLDDADEVVGCGSLEIGAQWTRSLGSAQLFIRGTYEGQLWAEAGAPTLTFLGFEGFGLSMGITH